MAARKKYRILVVDDESDITQIIKRGLEKQGFEVETFNDPLERYQTLSQANMT